MFVAARIEWMIFILCKQTRVVLCVSFWAGLILLFPVSRCYPLEPVALRPVLWYTRWLIHSHSSDLSFNIFCLSFFSWSSRARCTFCVFNFLLCGNYFTPHLLFDFQSPLYCITLQCFSWICFLLYVILSWSMKRERANNRDERICPTEITQNHSSDFVVQM